MANDKANDRLTRRQEYFQVSLTATIEAVGQLTRKQLPLPVIRRHALKAIVELQNIVAVCDLMDVSRLPRD